MANANSDRSLNFLIEFNLAVKLVLALKVREFSDSQSDFKGKGKNINSLRVF